VVSANSSPTKRSPVLGPESVVGNCATIKAGVPRTSCKRRVRETLLPKSGDGGGTRFAETEEGLRGLAGELPFFEAEGQIQAVRRTRRRSRGESAIERSRFQPRGVVEALGCAFKACLMGVKPFGALALDGARPVPRMKRAGQPQPDSFESMYKVDALFTICRPGKAQDLRCWFGI